MKSNLTMKNYSRSISSEMCKNLSGLNMYINVFNAHSIIMMFLQANKAKTNVRAVSVEGGNFLFKKCTKRKNYLCL